MSMRYMLLRLGRLGMIFGVAGLLFACASTTFRVEPETAQAGLVVGRIVLKASGFSSHPFSMTGTHTELTGVELTFENSIGVETTVKSRDGYFFLYDALDSDYVHLTRLYFKRTRSNGWRTFETRVVDGSERIRLKPGTVMNIGIVEWIVRGGGSASWNVQNVGHHEIESWFRETFHESGWLGANWETARLLTPAPRLRWEWHYEYH